ncbi:MAG: PilW family protein, partial [Candidatus Dormibacteria bacterium]
MKRQSGFTLIEVLVATAILLVAIAATLSALTDAIHANQGVTLMADTQENLRAAMNYMVRDIVQAGEGIPQGGITIPNNGLNPLGSGAPAPANSNLNRPGLSPTALPIIQFPTTYNTLPAVSPGSGIGEPQSDPSATVANAIVTAATGTDMITVTYVDNTLADNTYPPPNTHTL